MKPDGRDNLPRLRMSPREFTDLPEYSCSLPTGTTPGKRWRKHAGSYDPRSHLPKDDPLHIRTRWIIGEYFDLPNDDRNIGIRWYLPVISVRAA